MTKRVRVEIARKQSRAVALDQFRRRRLRRHHDRDRLRHSITISISIDGGSPSTSSNVTFQTHTILPLLARPLAKTVRSIA
jgi:hypothetical protein